MLIRSFNDTSESRKIGCKHAPAVYLFNHNGSLHGFLETENQK